MRYFTLLLFLFVVALTSCTPLRVVRLEPAASEPFDYYYGRRIMTSERSDAKLAVNYDENTRDYLIFTIDVVNQGEEPILVDPAACVLESNHGLALPAVDPEEELFRRDIAEIRSQRNQRIAGAALLTAATVVAVTTGTGPATGAATTEQVATTTAADVTLGVTDAINNSIFLFYGADRRTWVNDGPADPTLDDFWLNRSLRITTVPPGKAVAGQVVFPRNDYSTMLRLSCEVEGTVHDFELDQTIFRPNGEVLRVIDAR